MNKKYNIDKDYVLYEYYNNHRTLKEIAKDYGIHPNYLGKILREKFEITLKDRYSNRTELPKKEFGWLTPIKILEERNKEGRIQYLCKCRCGNTSIVAKRYLVEGHTTSCGCKIISNKTDEICYNGIVPGWYYAYTKSRCNILNREFELTYDDFCKSFVNQGGKCNLTNLEINFFPKSKKTQTTASLDRINPLLGYSINNIQWLHKDINFIKSSFTQETFLYICKAVSNFNAAEPYKKDYCNFKYLNSYYNILRNKSIKRKIKFDLTITDLIDIYIKQNGRCFLTNLPINIPTYKNKSSVLSRGSLDRINPLLPYQKNNVLWIIKEINLSKLDYSLDEYKYYCYLVYNHCLNKGMYHG